MADGTDEPVYLSIAANQRVKREDEAADLERLEAKAAALGQTAREHHEAAIAALIEQARAEGRDVRVVDDPDAPGGKRYIIDGEDEGTAPDLDTTGDDRLRRVLELNGFNAVQTEALGVVAAIAAMPLEALDAALLYHDQAVSRLRLDPRPGNEKMLRVAERHGRYLHSVRRWRRDLGDLEDRMDAAERIIAP